MKVILTKYTTEITIDLPRARVVELIGNHENMVKWQKGLLGYDYKSGNPGEIGAQTNFRYKMPGGEMDMLETIVSRNFPDEFTATYESKGVWNLNKNFFKEIGPDKTKWIIETEFKFSGFMKIFLLFNKKAFPRESLKQMNRFKEFAES